MTIGESTQLLGDGDVVLLADMLKKAEEDKTALLEALKDRAAMAHILGGERLHRGRPAPFSNSCRGKFADCQAGDCRYARAAIEKVEGNH